MIVHLIQPKMERRPMDTSLKARMAPSLGLLTIANLLEPDHTVILTNENIEDIDYDKPVDLVGITVTVDVMPRAIDIAKEFQKRGIPVVAGGIHITACPQTDTFDAISIGLAEKTWPEIIRDMQAGTLQKVYCCHEPIQGKDIVSPAYHLIDKRQYLYCNVISTSRGCPFQCDFCYNSCGSYKNFYVNRPIADVLGDIRRIGKKHVMFIDDNFIGNPSWTQEFVRAIKPMQLKWNAAVSANIVDMPELLDEMAESGCQSLFIGFESLNEKALAKVHKGQNQIEKYERLVEALHDRGIMINASFVFGLDEDDVSTFPQTIDWIVRHKIETVTSHILTPYPGTEVYARFQNDHRIIDPDLSHYNTAHVVFEPANMTKEELYEGYLDVYRQVYSLKNILSRCPKSRKQRIPYFLFNLVYRKYGWLTEKFCQRITYERIGRIAEKWSYH
ncbi:radical SAM protein [Ruminococcus sp.]|uniref:B12-binding domain-containing radical SAM protein n=1 Tax=Ruminococcus sp. TaxID=41978 RepID=UPI0025E1C8CA|nr:radical SAM protein [Ruminococcus sp.]